MGYPRRFIGLQSILTALSAVETTGNPYGERIMTRLRFLAMALVCCFGAALAADDKKPDDKKPEKLDPAKLLGKWKVVSGFKAGEKYEAKSGVVEIVKDKIILDDDMKFVFGYKVDLEKSPVTIDLEILEPEGLKGAKAPGIIKLEGGKVTLAYHPSTGERPKKFESTKENGFFMFVYEKVDPKKDEPKK